MATGSSSISAYIHVPGSHQSAFLVVGSELRTSQAALLVGTESVTPSQIPAFLTADVLVTSSFEGYIAGSGGEVTSRKSAFIGGPVYRSSVSVRFGGDGTGAIVAERDYIELETSDATIIKRFRVIAQGYNDGKLTKAESVERTIGGGIDHSQGATYRSWNPLIRVRHTESDSNYGTLAELETFYSYNDPGGTITPDITLYDHHNQSYTVHIVGDFEKSLMGVRTEGLEAWSLVKLELIEV